MKKSYKTYRGAYEGLQEYKYLERVKFLINNCDECTYKVVFNLKNAHGGSPKNVVSVASRNVVGSPKNFRVAIFDYDFKEENFLEAIRLASKKNIFPAYSIANFNLFLILHKKYYYKPTTLEDNYEKDLKKAYGLLPDADLKQEKNIDIIMDQITLENIKQAIKRAYKVNEQTRKTQNSIGLDIYNQPYLNIHIFLENVLNETFRY